MKPNEIVRKQLEENQLQDPVRTVEYASQSRPNIKHTVSVYADGYTTCTCEAYKFRHTCKHTLAVSAFDDDLDEAVSFRKSVIE